jgi:hypothetical protein
LSLLEATFGDSFTLLIALSLKLQFSYLAPSKSVYAPQSPPAVVAGISLELLPVNCTESYSRCVTPRARSATPRATPGLLRRQPAVQDSNRVLLSREGLLHRELLPVCYTESYSRSVTPRATPGQLHRELLHRDGTQTTRHETLELGKVKYCPFVERCPKKGSENTNGL